MDGEIMRKSVEKQKLMDILSEELADFRGGNAIQHDLGDILIIGLLCILCNGSTFVDMEMFGETHKDLLRQFLSLEHGIPSHDTFGRVFAKLDPANLDACFSHWLGILKEEVSARHVSIDGKTIRGSSRGGKQAKHIVTAFASDLQLVLGQLNVGEKNNEITEIPRLLDMFCVRKCTVTINAMGTQKEIAGKIMEKQGDYILALKENHPTLLADMRLYAEQEVFPQKPSLLRQQDQYAETIEKGHGRIETRQCWLMPDMSWLPQREEWAGLSGAAVIRSKRIRQSTGEVSESCRYFLYSDRSMTAERFLHLQRSHWCIENNLHWALDNLFHEDECQAYTEHAAEVLNILRKLCLYLTKQETSTKASMRTKRLRCSYDIRYAFKVLGFDVD